MLQDGEGHFLDDMPVLTKEVLSMRPCKPFAITLLMVPVLVLLPFSMHGPKNIVFAQDQGVQTKEPASSQALSKTDAHPDR